MFWKIIFEIHLRNFWRSWNPPPVSSAPAWVPPAGWSVVGRPDSCVGGGWVSHRPPPPPGWPACCCCSGCWTALPRWQRQRGASLTASPWLGTSAVGKTDTWMENKTKGLANNFHYYLCLSWYVCTIYLKKNFIIIPHFLYWNFWPYVFNKYLKGFFTFLLANIYA